MEVRVPRPHADLLQVPIYIARRKQPEQYLWSCLHNSAIMALSLLQPFVCFIYIHTLLLADWALLLQIRYLYLLLLLLLHEHFHVYCSFLSPAPVATEFMQAKPLCWSDLACSLCPERSSPVQHWALMWEWRQAKHAVPTEWPFPINTQLAPEDSLRGRIAS